MTNLVLTYVMGACLSMVFSMIFILTCFTMVLTVGFIKNDPWFMDEFTSNLPTYVRAIVVIVSIIFGIYVGYSIVL